MLTMIATTAALLAANGLTIYWLSDYYRQQGDTVANGRASQVQELLVGSAAQAHDWYQLDQSLQALGYRLAVSRNGAVVYSSLEPFQEQLYRELAFRPADGSVSTQREGVLTIVQRCGDCVAVAMSSPLTVQMFGRPRLRSEIILICVLVSGATAFGVILLFSLLFSRVQVKRIMRPINALADAAQRVEHGDLSTPIDYQGQDEFSAVCAAFDHMQSHLLEEREKNLAYEQARTDLVAGISHDLRTPLTSIKGYIKGLRDGVANTPEKQAQYLDVAYRKSCDMDRLLQRLFYFSRLETGNLPLFLVSTDLAAFVARFAKETQEELAHLGGEVILTTDGAPHPVLLDEEQMYRVLTNLKENALRYGGVAPLRLTLEVTGQEDRAVLRFADNGHGVPEEQLSHLFDQFWRGDQARGCGRGEGSGLGLYIVKYILAAHGGSVQAHNDQGLVFTMTIPQLDTRRTE
jgi:signal transduction histidine kinase